MTDGLPIPPEKLLEETRWLRSLARSLARNKDAEDLAQTTWLRALGQAPGQIRGLRPWLRSVLRNALSRTHRDAETRARRELAAARRDSLPSSAEQAARASLHRALVEAVLSLDEPARSTVLLR